MGRPASDLQNEFPNMDWSYFHNDPNTVIWWYDPTIPTPFNTIRKTTTSTADDGYDDLNVNGNVNPDGEIEEYHEWRPQGDGQLYMCPGEPDMVFQRRMEALRMWIYNNALRQQNDDETISSPSTESKIINVLTIGHWGVYKYFTDGMEMENCQVSSFEM